MQYLKPHEPLKHMNPVKIICTAFLLTLILTSCSSGTKVLAAWKAQQDVVDGFKEKNVLVIARTADNQARIAFENEIASALRSAGIKATESYSRAPKIHAQVEMSEERMALMRKLMESEGYNAIVLTVVKDKKQSLQTSSSGIYVGATYNNYYPGYYGNFYSYYRYPYAYGGYYSSFGGYIPVSNSTRLVTDYVLETVAYNLDSENNDQLVAVVTTELDDPRNAYKVAEKYVQKIFESLQKLPQK